MTFMVCALIGFVAFSVFIAFMVATFALIGFIAFFVFWQHIRNVFCKPKFVFVDKMCINQSDEALKTAGILALGGQRLARLGLEALGDDELQR